MNKRNGAIHFVRQPNGMLALYSAIVHDLVLCDLTVHVAMRYCREGLSLSQIDAEVLVYRADDSFHADAWNRDGLARWREALLEIERAHGKVRRAERAHLVGVPTIPAMVDIIEPGVELPPAPLPVATAKRDHIELVVAGFAVLVLAVIAVVAL